MLDGRRQFLHAEHETTVTANTDHAFARIGDLDAEGRMESETEIILVAAGYVLSRRIHRECHSRCETALRNLFDEETVFGQYLANSPQELGLRFDHCQFFFGDSRVGSEFGGSIGAPVDH